MAQTDGGEAWGASQADLERMTSAAAIIRDCRRELEGRNTNLVGEVMAGMPAICEWQHYPAGEVYDPKTHAQYFYHMHAATGRPAREHGHFHTFLRADGMPAGVAPLLLPELAVAEVSPAPRQASPIKHGTRDEVSHLIALALDARGEPIRLFTTNRWVTGETWYRADDVIRMLDRFTVAEVAPSEVLNRWISAMLQLFRPQIVALLRARDDTVMAWRRRRRAHVFEDARLEITSSLEVELDAHLARLDRFQSAPAARALRRARALPPMAEGWQEEGCAG